MYNLYANLKLFCLKTRIKLFEGEDPYMNGLVYDARIYSFMCDTLTRHQYDGKHYSVHTYLVYHFAKKYIHLIPEEDREYVLAAAFTHDLIEDCRETFNDVKKATNRKVARLTSALTTYVHGHTREARAPKSYYIRILSVKYGDYLKYCDRLANMYYSFEKHNEYKGETMFAKYCSELEHFLHMLENTKKNKGAYAPMINELKELGSKIH